MNMEEEIISVFNAQQVHKFQLRLQEAKQRIQDLKALKKCIQKYELEVYKALSQDLRKSTFESAVTEVIFIYGELDHAINHVSNWMKPKRIGKTLSNPLASNKLYYEPKGVCLIISPWNYPFQLTIGPLISAIAAGNCCMVKPSEFSPATSAVVAKIIKETFSTNQIACFEGEVGVSTSLLKLPFDHIFFTGSTSIGKIVMEAAAKNLTSVTLELGGKSPTIIDEDVNLVKAAEKVAWGKLVNSGQTCIAPDYVFVPEKLKEAFIKLYHNAVKQFYYKNGTSLDERIYGKIINRKQFDRLKNLVNDAIDKGAIINVGGTFDDQNLTIHPVVLSQIPASAKVMEEEIFGPILPIITYTDLSEVIAKINAKAKPLALYIFSNNQKNINSIIKQTSAGGTCVNDVLIHISNPKLPFGGVNSSGMGASHGIFGFKNFSHERAVVFQRKLDFNSMIYPPYDGKEWVLKLLRKIM